MTQPDIKKGVCKMKEYKQIVRIENFNELKEIASHNLRRERNIEPKIDLQINNKTIKIIKDNKQNFEKATYQSLINRTKGTYTVLTLNINNQIIEY